MALPVEKLDILVRDKSGNVQKDVAIAIRNMDGSVASVTNGVSDPKSNVVVTDKNGIVQDRYAAIGTYLLDDGSDSEDNPRVHQHISGREQARRDVAPVTYKGTWDASTNTPTLADGTGEVGDLYKVTTPARRNLGSGSKDWADGDEVVYNGAIWDQWGVSIQQAELRLALASNPGGLVTGTITRDANEAATAATITWPDGVTGTYTGTPSATFLGAIDSYVLTYGARTYTQPTVTRDASGAVTARPAIVVT